MNSLRKKLAFLEDETESVSGSASSENPAVVQDAVRGLSVWRTATKYTALESIYALLAAASPNLVEDVVTQIRGGTSVEAVAARVTSMDHAIVRGHSF